MQVLVTNGCDERFILLCKELDEYLNDVVGGEKQHQQYAHYNTLEDIHDVVLIIEDGVAVGCGSFKAYNHESAEIKRVFVRDQYKGRKYGRTIIEGLEAIAKEKGYNKLILETGKPLKAAMHFYQKLDYRIIDNYGPYANMSDSICMEKNLIKLP